jgi:hypothetical protein
MDKIAKVETTKKGYPALWECGGGYTSTGGCTIIAGKQGERLNPVYVRHGGSLSCSDHALLIVDVGYHIIQAAHERGDYEIDIYRIDNFDKNEKDGKYARLTLTNQYSEGEWDKEPENCMIEAIHAAKKKANCYHCREPHYVKYPDE